MKGQSINSEEKKLLEVNGRDLSIYDRDSFIGDLGDFVKQSIDKKNEYSSVVSLFFDVNYMKEFVNRYNKARVPGDFHISANDVSIALLATSFFIRKLNVYLSERDTHSEPSLDTLLRSLVFFDKELDEKIVVSGDKLISKTELKEYQAQVKKMTKFIKLFKPELREISIDKKANGDLFRCRLVMNYDSYSIDYEYESTGLKNLMEMFSCLEQASLGGIAFIDEMDANINEVYLEKLCEFFSKHVSGQLCFTTHNTSPMRILKKQKHGIDFINNDKQSVQWVRNGNYSPSKLYSEGMIPGLPFNIEDFDFLSVFFSEEK